MLGRELAIALRAPVTWIQAALSALLVGHGFVLAIDIFSAGSRSATANVLMARELDPLLGIVRPTLGGLYLSLSLLGGIVAARVMAVEKERGTLTAWLLETSSPWRVLLTKYVAALAAVSVQLIVPLVLFSVWAAGGGHLAVGETSVSVLAYVVYAALIAALGVAAACWTATLAQASTIVLVTVATSWAIDAADGFAALAWLGRLGNWSVTPHLAAFEHGIVDVGGAAWLLALTGGLLALGRVGMLPALTLQTRAMRSAVVALATLIAVAATSHIHRLFDASESRRNSLPADVAAALPRPLELEIMLDRDDARRQQMERDVLTKLRIAAPDVRLVTPLDERAAPSELEQQEGYGTIIVRVPGGERETYSTSRKELVTLAFEAAGVTRPPWIDVEYPGYPHVIEGSHRTAVASAAYGALPLGLGVIGSFVVRNRRRRQS